MNSPLLALFVRSVREDLRSRATYWARAGLGGILLLVVASFATANRWVGAPGRTFFLTVISFQIVAVTFAGLSYFASAIAEEKEEQTLGLLRMTSLDPLSILLGKSTSRLCGALFLLVAQFPFTIFAITLGGVSLGQLTAVYCTLGAFIFLLCNLCLLGSVLARRTAGAATFCVLVLAVLVGLGPLLEFLGGHITGFHGLGETFKSAGSVLWKTTPIDRLREIMITGFAGSPVSWQVGSNLVLGVVCFLLAWAVFERFCDRDLDSVAPAANPGVGRTSFWWSRRPRVWKDALLWKDFYFVCGGQLGFALRVIGYGGGLVIFLCRVLHVGRDVTTVLSGMVPGVVSFVLSVDLAIAASRIFGLELREQTLPVLATLPLSMRKIASSKALASLLAFAPALVALLAIQASFVMFPPPFAGGTNPFSMIHVMIVQDLSGWVSTVLLVYVVAWLSLHMKRGAAPVGWLATHIGAMIVNMIFMMFIALNSFRLLQAGSTGNLSSMTALFYLSPAVTAVVSIGVTILLHFRGLRRLEELAGET